MGTSANDQNRGAGSGNVPAVVPGQNGPGTGADNGGAGGSDHATPASNGIDRGKLSPLIAGMSEQQINETFDTLFQAVRRPIDQTPPRPEAVRKPAPTAEELKERFDPISEKFDPAGAVREMVETNYGGLIADMGAKANEGMFLSLRSSLPDFKDHEEDIRKVVKDVPPNMLNQQMLTNTYFSVVGAKEVGRKLREQQRPPTTVTPSTQQLENDTKLSDDEKSVAHVMFRHTADPEGEYKKAQKMMDEGGFTVKVPGEVK